ncbi:MAG: hypothetical protein RL557_114 [archaeon]|jgi:hypothetical protein
MTATIINLVQEDEGVGITFDNPVDASDAFHILKSLHAVSGTGYVPPQIESEGDTTIYRVMNGSLQFEIRMINNIPQPQSRNHFAHVPSTEVSNRLINYFQETRK